MSSSSSRLNHVHEQRLKEREIRRQRRNKHRQSIDQPINESTNQSINQQDQASFQSNSPHNSLSLSAKINESIDCEINRQTQQQSHLVIDMPQNQSIEQQSKPQSNLNPPSLSQTSDGSRIIFLVGCASLLSGIGLLFASMHYLPLINVETWVYVIGLIVPSCMIVLSLCACMFSNCLIENRLYYTIWRALVIYMIGIQLILGFSLLQAEELGTPLSYATVLLLCSAFNALALSETSRIDKHDKQKNQQIDQSITSHTSKAILGSAFLCIERSMLRRQRQLNAKAKGILKPKVKHDQVSQLAVPLQAESQNDLNEIQHWHAMR